MIPSLHSVFKHSTNSCIWNWGQSCRTLGTSFEANSSNCATRVSALSREGLRKLLRTSWAFRDRLLRSPAILLWPIVWPTSQLWIPPLWHAVSCHKSISTRRPGEIFLTFFPCIVRSIVDQVGGGANIKILQFIRISMHSQNFGGKRCSIYVPWFQRLVHYAYCNSCSSLWIYHRENS